MKTLRDWLDKLREFDPDDWGEMDTVRAQFDEDELDSNAEIKIDFTSENGKIEQVVIRLLDDADNVVVELEYTVFQLDVVPLTEFIRDSVFEDE